MSVGLSYKQSLAIIDASHQKADELGVKVTVAVVDLGGHLIALGRQDGAPALSAQIAESKAVGTAVFLKDGDDLMALQISRPQFFSQVDRLVRMPMMPGLGSLLIKHNSHTLGSVGVSGATPEQDKQIALAGIATVSETISGYIS